MKVKKRSKAEKRALKEDWLKKMGITAKEDLQFKKKYKPLVHLKIDHWYNLGYRLFPQPKEDRIKATIACLWHRQSVENRLEKENKKKLKKKIIHFKTNLVQFPLWERLKISEKEYSKIFKKMGILDRDCYSTLELGEKVFPKSKEDRYKLFVFCAVAKKDMEKMMKRDFKRREGID